MKKILVLGLVMGSFVSAQTSEKTVSAVVGQTVEKTATPIVKVKKVAKKKTVKPNVQINTEKQALTLKEPVQTEQTVDPAKASTSASVAPAAAGTSTTTSASVAPAKKVTGSLLIGAAAMVNDLKDNGSRALIDTSNTLTVMYSATDKIKVGVGHNFGFRVISDRAQLADFSSDGSADSPYKTLDPTLNFNYKMQPLFGSNEYAILSKYYVPVSDDSRVKKSNGTLRTQAYITWSMNPNVDISFFGQARLYLNSSNNTDTKLGSDSVLRTIIGPVFGYNFNDVWNVYYNPYLDMRSSGFQRGKFDADVANGFSQDLGLWISLVGGKYIINPAWVTSASKLSKSTYEGAGADANSEYDLTLIATF
ncbi:MAG: hypothetical protein WA160_08505 [Pseudobdellovibrio sp.]